MESVFIKLRTVFQGDARAANVGGDHAFCVSHAKYENRVIACNRIKVALYATCKFDISFLRRPFINKTGCGSKVLVDNIIIIINPFILNITSAMVDKKAIISDAVPADSDMSIFRMVMPSSETITQLPSLSGTVG